MANINNKIIMITGYSATGKTASLRNLRNQERWLYISTEAAKELPFQNNFVKMALNKASNIHDVLKKASATKTIDGVIIDSLTYLMDMYESQEVLTAPPNARYQAWSDYQQFFKKLLQETAVELGKPLILIAHVKDFYDEASMETKTYVPLKGSLANQGAESYVNFVISTKRMSLNKLENYKNDLLTVSEEENVLGFKYVFQTRLTKESLNERIRTPMGMFSIKETFVDNDVQILLDKIDKYYEKGNK